MDTLHSTEDGAVRKVEFRYQPGSSRYELRELGLFRLRLLAALRVAHGLGGGLELSWETGTTGGIALTPQDPRSTRWVRQVLAPAYTGGRWVEHRRAPGRKFDHHRRIAVMRPGALAPLGVSADNPPWCDTALLALGLLSPGVRIHWEAQPIFHSPTYSSPPPANTLVQVPPGWRTKPVTRPEQALLDQTTEHAWSSHWMVRGTVGASEPTVGPSMVEDAARAVSRAGRCGGGGEVAFRREGLLRTWGFGGLLFGEQELIGLFPTPWAPLALIPEACENPTTPLWIGLEGRPTSTAWRIERRTGRHLLTIGETGMGKSSLLVRLAAQASRIGGVVLFDPIGDTSERLLAALPTSALDRTTWVSPSFSPTGINALRGIHGPRASGDTTTERRLGDLVYALRRVRAQHYGETPFWGPRIEETVTLALEAAAAYPGGTLVTALEILQGSDHPGRVVPESASAVSAELRQRVVDRPEEVDGARRLLAEVGRSGVLRAMLCDADARWEWGEALKRGNITVISGDASDVGEQTSRYLLAIHLALLWSAVVERRSPSKLFVFLDEAHWFAHESAAEMLRMGRRFNLHLILATQALDSLPLAVREAALTNSGDWAVFRGSPMDAKEVSRWVPNLPLDHVLNLPRGQALVLLGKGREVFSTAVPFGHRARDTPERIARVARLSAAQYGSSRTPDGPNPPAPGPTGAPPEQSRPTTRSGRTNRVKTTLGAGAAAAGEDETFRVHLPALRTVCDPDGTQVREVGNELRRLGGLVDSGRDSQGSFWVLRVEIVRQTPSYTPPPEEKSDAESRWRQVGGDGLAPG